MKVEVALAPARSNATSVATSPTGMRNARSSGPSRSGGYIESGGDLVSTWSVLRMSCKPRSPVGLVKQPGTKQVRRTISHSPPNLVR